MGASPRGGSPGSLSPRPASPRHLSPREPAHPAPVHLQMANLDAGTEAVAPTAEEEEPRALQHEISLAPGQPAPDLSPAVQATASAPSASTTAGLLSQQPAAAELRSESGLYVAIPAVGQAAETAIPPLLLPAVPSSSAGGELDEGATFSAFAAAQAQRGGAAAVSLSDTMFASVTSTAARAPETDAGAPAQSASGSAMPVISATGAVDEASRSGGSGTGGEQETAGVEPRGMPPRESMLSATDLVEHGQRAGAAETEMAAEAPPAGEDAEASVHVDARLPANEAFAAASGRGIQPDPGVEASSGPQPLVPADKPLPAVDALKLGAATGGAPTDAAPGVDTEHPSVRAALDSASAADVEVADGPQASDGVLGTDAQGHIVQGDAGQSATTDADTKSTVLAASDASFAVPQSAAVGPVQTDDESAVLTPAPAPEAASAPAQAAEPLTPADGPSGALGTQESPTVLQPDPGGQPVAKNRGSAGRGDLASTPATSSAVALPEANEPPDAVASAASGPQQPGAASAPTISEEGDDMLDAQSQHSEGSTVSI